ncbi:MAG: hypothetical protein K0S55_2036 [Clostridia bacterium]|nr:hypothetical protein [Clostridia bacterium]
MKKLFKLSALLTCIAVVIGCLSYVSSIAINGTTIDILKEYSVDDLKDAKDLPRFRNKAQLMEFVNSYFYNSENILTKFGMGMNYTTDNAVAAEVAPAAPAEAPETPAATPPDAGGAYEDKASSSNDSDVSSTNVQVEGVDEGDIIKTDGKYIYIIRGNELIIVDAEKEKVASRLDIFENNNYGNINSIYLKDDKVILIGSLTRYYDENDKEVDEDGDVEFGKPVDKSPGMKLLDVAFAPPYYDYGYGYYNSKNFVSVNIIDITDKKLPKEIRNLEYEGYLVSGRETDGKVYIVVNKSFNYFYGVKPMLTDVLPEHYDSAFENTTVKATDIAKAPGQVQPNIMTIAAIDYINNKPAETLNILGNGTKIYMTKSNLYIFGDYWGPKNGSYTTVVKYNIENGIKYIANTKVLGTVATQFAFDEYNNNFRIATTTNMYNNEQTNNVFVYDQKLNKIGELTKIAPSEKIYSVRFMGDTAYIVTFRQVDPLFVIDMSKDDPEILGELKVPGFSTYLHPVGENLLLGIGKETKDEVYENWDGSESVSTRTVGLKISLFDVSDKANPKELDVISSLGGEYAYSEAEYNHLAFVYSDKTQTGYLPIIMPNFRNSTLEKGDYYYNYEGAGFAAVTIKDGQLEAEIAVPKNEDGKYEFYNYSTQRICYIDNDLYFYQNERLVLFDRATMAQKGLINIQ